MCAYRAAALNSATPIKHIHTHNPNAQIPGSRRLKKLGRHIGWAKIEVQTTNTSGAVVDGIVGEISGIAFGLGVGAWCGLGVELEVGLGVASGS